MNPPDPVNSTVKRGMLDGKTMPDALAVVATACSAGAQCPEVQNDPVAAAALANLTAMLTAADASVTDEMQVAQEHKAATTKAGKAFKKVKTALSTYETAVNGVAAGDAALINKAGLNARAEVKAVTPPVEKVVKVASAPSTVSQQATLHWPVTPGADHFEVQVNFTPTSPTPQWTSLGTCTRRRKVVTAPAPGAQFLARIGAIASDGTRADWSDTILATAR